MKVENPPSCGRELKVENSPSCGCEMKVERTILLRLRSEGRETDPRATSESATSLAPAGLALA